MKKDTILIVAGAGDFFFGENSHKKIKDKEALIDTLNTIISNGSFKAVTNLTTPHDTLNEVSIYDNLRTQSLVTYTLHSDTFLHKNNELSLNSLDNEEILLDGDKFDYVFRPSDYDVHLCGVDVNGAFKSTIEELLTAGFHVTVYSDAIRPFSSTHKYISSLIKATPKFRYCSYKSV